MKAHKKILLLFSFALASQTHAQTTCYVFQKDLYYSIGAYEVSTEVSKLQNFLKVKYNLYDSQLMSSGYFGLVTKRWVEKYQNDNQLIVSGVVENTTRNKINNECIIKDENVVASSSTNESAPNINASTSTDLNSSLPASTSGTVTTSTTSTTSEISTSPSKFKTIWIEPLQLVMTRKGQATVEDVKNLVKEYKKLGFERIIIAYTLDFNDRFLYKPTFNWSFESYKATSSPRQVISTDPMNYNQLLNDGDFIQAILSEADTQNIEVYLGLSRTGDLYLLNDIENKLKGHPASSLTVWEKPGQTVTDRLTGAINASTNVAKDLLSLYNTHTSFKGIYLPHEVSCIDIGNNYFQYASAAIKKLDPTKKIIISPTMDSKVCFNTSTYDKEIIASGADEILYQDTIGAGTLNINGFSDYLYNDSARDQRILSGKELLKNLKAFHDKTNVIFSINTEAWRMDGLCRPIRYGCAFPTSMESLIKQITPWLDITKNLMLNEGLLMFDFNINNLKSTDARILANSEKFTQDYKTFLAESNKITNLPKVSITAEKNSIPKNTSTTISWKGVDVQTCSLSTNNYEWYSGSSFFSSAFPTGNIQSDTTYTLTCRDAGGALFSTSTVIKVI